MQKSEIKNPISASAESRLFLLPLIFEEIELILGVAFAKG